MLSTNIHRVVSAASDVKHVAAADGREGYFVHRITLLCRRAGTPPDKTEEITITLFSDADDECQVTLFSADIFFEGSE